MHGPTEVADATGFSMWTVSRNLRLLATCEPGFVQIRQGVYRYDAASNGRAPAPVQATLAEALEPAAGGPEPDARGLPPDPPANQTRPIREPAQIGTAPPEDPFAPVTYGEPFRVQITRSFVGRYGSARGKPRYRFRDEYGRTGVLGFSEDGE
jgi:hypothetical protein